MWFLPSRGRPHLAQRLFSSDVKEPGVLILDHDDAAQYADLPLPAGWRSVVYKRIWLSGKLNQALSQFAGEPWYGILNDDHLPKTEGWERSIVDAALKHGIAWPHDNYAKRISCHAKSGELVSKLGWFVCPRMKHFWLDDADELIAREIGGVFLEDVMVSHEHVNAGRMQIDRTYLERPDNRADKAAFESWKATEWPWIKSQLKAA